MVSYYMVRPDQNVDLERRVDVLQLVDRFRSMLQRCWYLHLTARKAPSLE